MNKTSFISNYAADGGSLYFSYDNRTTAIIIDMMIIDNRFINNSALMSGGCIFIYESATKYANITF